MNEHPKPPEYLILDIQTAVKSLLTYIEKGFGKLYLDPTTLINTILEYICQDEPQEGLHDCLHYIEITLSNEGFAINDLVDITREVEMLGYVIIAELDALGIYQCKDFWGYRILCWMSPTSFILTEGPTFDIGGIINKLVVEN